VVTDDVCLHHDVSRPGKFVQHGTSGAVVANEQLRAPELDLHRTVAKVELSILGSPNQFGLPSRRLLGHERHRLISYGGA